LIKEEDRLNRIAAKSKYAYGANGWTTDYSFKVFERFISGSSILELGPAEGVMTKNLYKLDKNLTIVEASKEFCLSHEKNYPKAKVVNSLFENFRPEGKFDNIILGHVLEHVENPIDLLKLYKSFLNPHGRVICAVPNARSLHRQAAVLLGLLETEESLNEADIHHGHRRVFNPETFRNAFITSGFQIDFFGGYWIKSLSNTQVEATHSKEMIEAFMRLGERYPDIAAELVIVAS
jgi:2-polyprenyl-3-methyl-5-hydroxy-6-metoxy-1,4-benzoquinol methylase